MKHAWWTRGLGCMAAGAALLGACVTSRPGEPTAPVAADRQKHITVLFIADLHAQLDTHLELFSGEAGERFEEAGGFSRLTTAIAQVRAERPGAVLLVDGGDTLHGSGVAALTRGAAVVPAIAPLGIDVGVPGNWEVVYGATTLMRRAAELGHPLVAANVRDARTGARMFPPYVVRDVGGVRLAVVGFTDPDVPRRQPPAYSAGVRYEGADDLAQVVARARSEGRADVVLLASHIGLPKAIALTREVPGIDVHLSADTHERTYEPVDVDGTWVVEPGAFGSFLGRLDLQVERGRVVHKAWRLIEVTAGRFAADPHAQAVVDAAVAPLRPRLEQVVGESSAALMRYDVVEASLDAVLADALRAATGSEVALSNGFRFGPPIGAGPIREADLWSAYPVATRLKTGRVTGAQLRTFWERELESVFSPDPSKRFGGWLPRPSGMTLRFEAGAPEGRRIRELRVAGELVDDRRSYSITACEREGDPPDMVCRIPGARDVRVLDIDAHEAVRRHLRGHRPLRAPTLGRVVADDLPTPLRTQVGAPGSGHEIDDHGPDDLRQE